MTRTLLVDVDSTIPNLALMHISAWKKKEGHEVGFNVSDPDEVYASCICGKDSTYDRFEKMGKALDLLFYGLF